MVCYGISGVVNSILLFYLGVVRKHECKFVKQYQFVFCLFNFPIKRIGTIGFRAKQKSKLKRALLMREEETQVSRLLSVQVCNIPLSLIPFLDIEIKK